MIVLTALFHINLLIATNIRNTLIVATALGALVTGVSFAFVFFGDDDELFYIPRHSNALVPPMLQVSEGHSMEDYLGRVNLEIEKLTEEE